MPVLTKHFRRLSFNLQKRRSSSKDAEKEDYVVSPRSPTPSHIKWDLAQLEDRPRPTGYLSWRRVSSSASGISDLSLPEGPVTPDTPGLTPDTAEFSHQLGRAMENVGFGNQVDANNHAESQQTDSNEDSAELVSDERDDVQEIVEKDNNEEVNSDAPELLAARICHQSTSSAYFASLPRELWVSIAGFLPPADAAALAFVNRETATRLGPFFWPRLNFAENKEAKTAFLSHMEAHLPDHILCKPCARYHARHAKPDRPKYEVLRGSYDSKPLLASPCKSKSVLPSVRLTLDFHLQFHLAKLVMASEHFDTAYGAPISQLNRSWTPQNPVWADIAASYTVDTTWTHKTRFAISRQPSKPAQLLMKVTSIYYPRANLTPSEQRLILSCRKDYTANYTTCAHESRGGILFTACRCALSHIPYHDPRRGELPRKTDQCHKCRGLWKCMLCPSEYQVEVKLESQKSKFRHALIVTRWTNLGTCRQPEDAEWEACSSLWEYQDEQSRIYRGSEERTVRNMYESAAGEMQSLFRMARPLRRPSHWRSEENRWA